MYNVQKWNLEIQKSFGKSTVLSVNYLGNHGTHKPFTNAGLNAFSPSASTAVATAAKPYILGLPTTQPDPRFGTVYYYQSGGSNNYNGVIVTVSQKFLQGGIITAGYTYGKILDTGANGFSTSTATGTVDIGSPVDPYNTNRNYGPATTDERHNLVLSYVYRLPFRNAFYGGWEVSGAAFAYSGLPFTAVDTSLSPKLATYANGAYGGTLLPTYLGGGEQICGYGKQQCVAGLKLANGIAPQFSSFLPGLANTATVDSNESRNFLRGPMYVSTDFAITKDIPLHWKVASSPPARRRSTYSITSTSHGLPARSAPAASDRSPPPSTPPASSAASAAGGGGKSSAVSTRTTPDTASAGSTDSAVRRPLAIVAGTVIAYSRPGRGTSAAKAVRPSTLSRASNRARSGNGAVDIRRPFLRRWPARRRACARPARSCTRSAARPLRRERRRGPPRAPAPA